MNINNIAIYLVIAFFSYQVFKFIWKTYKNYKALSLVDYKSELGASAFLEFARQTKKEK